MGSFHMIKCLLACVGKYLRGSDAKDIWVENSVFGVDVVKSVFNATDYARSLKGISLLSETMQRLQWIEFFKDTPVLEFKEVFECLANLKQLTSENDREKSKYALNTFKTVSPELSKNFINGCLLNV